MNEFSAYAHRIRGGWWGMLRFAKDAKPKPIMGPQEKPVVFPDELSATKAVLHHMVSYFNGDYRNWSDPTSHHEAADNLFPTLKKPVERRRARA